MFHANDTLGTVVTKFPSAATIFQDVKIDFCCGGARTIEQASQEAGLSLDALMNEINAAWERQQSQQQQTVNWQEAPLSELVDHILQAHHAYLHENMPIIGELTTKILRVHGEHHSDVLTPLHRTFHLFKLDMEEHLIKEEGTVFPLIKSYDGNLTAAALRSINQIIERLEQEHDEAGQQLKAMREATHDYDLPADACRTYTRTYQLLQELEENTFLHVHLENNVLFPRLRKMEAELLGE